MVFRFFALFWKLRTLGESTNHRIEIIEFFLWKKYEFFYCWRFLILCCQVRFRKNLAEILFLGLFEHLESIIPRFISSIFCINSLIQIQLLQFSSCSVLMNIKADFFFQFENFLSWVSQWWNRGAIFTFLNNLIEYVSKY